MVSNPQNGIIKLKRSTQQNLKNQPEQTQPDHRLQRLLAVVLLLVFLTLSVMPVAALEDSPDLQQQPFILRVAYDPLMAPLHYETPEGPTGFSIDLMNAIGRLNDWEIQYQPLPLSQAQRALQQGEVDAILAMDYQARLAADMDFTEPYLSSSVGLIVPAEETAIESVADLSERLVAIRRQSQEHDFLQNVWRINFNNADSIVVGFQLLGMGRADALAGDRLMIQHYLEEQELESQYRFVSSYLIPLEYAMTVNRENFSLLNQLNRGLQQVKGLGIYNELQEEWFGDDGSQARLEEMLRNLGLFLAIIVVIFLFSLWWNHTLKKEVNRKTSELKAANQGLEFQILETRNMSQLMEQIMRNSPRGLMTIDREGMVTALNPRAQVLTREENSLKDRHYAESTLLNTLVQPRMKNVLDEGMQYVGGEQRWRYQDDEQVDIRYTLYPARDVEGQTTGMILTLEDITDERKVREEGFEREKSRALHQVVAGIAHEIRNPLTSIKTFVELIPAKLHNLQFQENIVYHVPREIDRVSQLIESLIDYARPQAPNKEIFDANELMETCYALFDPVFENRGLLMETKLEPGCYIQADRNQMKQVLVNFFLNGLEAMEEKLVSGGGAPPLKMTASCRCSRDQVLIELRDEGIGMSPEELKIMLEPFYSTKKSGTGLGLPLSKRYLEDNGATLSVDSEKGRGTTISLEFERMKHHGQDSDH